MNQTDVLSDPDDLLANVVDEFFDAVENGESPRLEDYLERYPKIADLLKVAIPVLQVAEESPDSELRLHEGEERLLGDFRILRQLGRGGMGVVYEAEQISMRRRVALKVLPLAGLVDKVKVKRFHNEVRAVAALDHPNIVSVFMVGEERGVHYYAMQLIRGRNLAEVLNSLKEARSELGARSDVDIADSIAEVLPAGESPPEPADSEHKTTVAQAADSTIPHDSRREYFRRVAALGIQAAKALQHAHEQGVIHRDIKPANLLIDSAAKLSITDFGLARMQADAGMTMSGDLLGTLRYMAPEQALAKQVELDHRADIYSLSTTLYELIALQPAYASNDREKLLKQLAFDEPSPLRRLDPEIPVDLETIVLKGMSKDRNDRYSTCDAMADDLKRFLDHRPIAAKAPSLLQIVKKWTRRNPSLAWAATICWVLVTFAFGLSTLLIAQQRDQAIATGKQLRASLYVSETNLAFQAWTKENLPRTLELLASQIPQSDEADLRGTEWYYLATRCDGNRGQSVARYDRAHSIGPNGILFCSRLGDDLILANLNTGKKDVIAHNQSKATEWVDGTAISPDGETVAAAMDAGIRIIDCETLESTFVDAPATECVGFSPHGNWGAHVDAGGTAHLWNPNTGKIAWSMKREENDGYPKYLKFSPDGEKLAVAFDSPGSVTVWQVADGKNRTIPVEQEFIGQLEFVDEHAILIAGGGPKGLLHVKLNAVGSNDMETPWLPPTRYVSAFHIHSDSKRIAIGTENNVVEVWNTQTQELLLRRLRNRKIALVRIGKKGNELIVASDGIVKQNLLAGPTSELARGTKHFWPECISVDGEELAFAGPSHNVVIWNPVSGLRRIVEFGEDLPDTTADGEFDRKRCQVWTVAHAPNGSIAAAGKGDGVIRVWDKTGQLVHRYSLGIDSARIRYSADGKTLAVGGTDRVTLVNAETGGVQWKGPNRPSTVTLSFSPDGKRLVTGGGNWRVSGLLSIWNITDGTYKLAKEFDHEEIVLCTAISADSRWLVAGDYSGRVTFYDLQKYAVHKVVSAHPMAVQSFAFSPDGKLLVSGAYDGSLKFWQVPSWKELGEVFEPKPVRCLRFISSDAKGLGIVIGTQAEGDNTSATQKVHWIDSSSDWNWLQDD